MSPRRAAWLSGLAAFAAFLPALRFPLLSWDDDVNILGNAGLALSPQGLLWMATGSKLGHWQPLTWLTLAVDKALWGGAAAGFHLGNILLHALSAGLLALCARRLLRDEEGWACLLAAGLWALHPLRVESVAWVTERRDVLSGAFLLGSLYAHLRAEGAEERRWSRWALALGACAMLSKVFAVVWPAVLLVLDGLVLERGWRWREKAPYLLFALPALALNLIAQSSGAAVPWSAFGLEPRLAQACLAVAFYPAKTLWPAGLSPLYEFSALLQPAPFSFALAGGLAAALWWALWGREHRRLTAAWLCYALLLAPALGLFKSGRMSAADRWSYLPALPLSLLLASLAKPLLDATAGRAAAAVLLAGLCGLTWRQLPAWSSDVALWETAAARSPLSYYARLKLASAYAAAGERARADAARRDALAVHRLVFETAAAVLANRGDEAGAAAASRRAMDGPAVAP